MILSGFVPVVAMVNPTMLLAVGGALVAAFAVVHFTSKE